MQTRRHSYKRDAIMDYLRGAKTHPSAETIFRELKPRFPDLSLATVYRNLAQLKSDGCICGVGVVDGEERFDADTSAHPHLVCASCGRVSDLSRTVDLSEHAAWAATEGIEITGYSVTFYGRCLSCCENGDSR